MLGHRFGIPAAVLLLAIAPPVKAGLTTYTWGPIRRSGYYFDYLTGSTICFSSGGGEITIGYDPNDLFSSYIDVETGPLSTGGPGLGILARSFFAVTVTPGRVEFTALDMEGAYAQVDSYDDPGPLNSDGDPISLAPLLGDWAYVFDLPGYHTGFVFVGGPSPEPSTLVMLPLGLTVVTPAGAARRSRGARSPGKVETRTSKGVREAPFGGSEALLVHPFRGGNRGLAVRQTSFEPRRPPILVRRPRWHLRPALPMVLVSPGRHRPRRRTSPVGRELDRPGSTARGPGWRSSGPGRPVRRSDRRKARVR